MAYTRDNDRPGLTKDQLAALKTPIHPTRVRVRDGNSYVEAYDVKATLIRIFGYGGFSADVLDSKIVEIRSAATHPDHKKKGGEAKAPQVLTQATVRLTIHATGATYTESAIGNNSGYDIGDAADHSIKSAASDALKRCATYLGSQYGLSLYQDGSTNEVVRVVFEPDQRAEFDKIDAENMALIQQQQQEAQEKMNRATGGDA